MVRMPFCNTHHRIHPTTAHLACTPLFRSQLEQLSGEVSVSLDKLEGREQQLTNQFQGLLDTYRESRQQLTDMQEEFSRCGCCG